MSIKFEREEGWLLCHKNYVNYHINVSDCKQISYQLKDDIFNVETPFVMDSQANKLSYNGNPEEETNTQKRRKRKKESIKTNKNKQFIIDAAKAISSASKYFDDSEIMPEQIRDNNRSARTKVESLHAKTNLVTLPENVLHQSCNYVDLREFQDSIETILPALIANNRQDATILRIKEEEYIIPPISSFILADLDRIEKILLNRGETFDAILLDPPWENKSIKRLKKYPTLSNERLLKFPLKNLANEDCLVAVWTTNNLDQNSFVKEVLFPSWKVKYLTDWHWVKMTKKGEFAIPLDSPNKCIHENLAIGRFTANSNVVTRQIENNKVIVSVPSLIHSHKPPLTEILKHYLKKDYKGLEIFARYLMPGWTSCGNEVLKLQNINYYDCKNSVLNFNNII